MNFEPIIGLEIHVQPKTKSKMFCRCPAEVFGAKPNTYVCPVCLGLPGALPVPNKKAIELTLLLGLGLNCEIKDFSKFDRKNYFYPDLPKGYQISQYDKPLAGQGSLKLKFKGGQQKVIRIRRVHIEEDTGKLIHKRGYSLIDYNRSGVPLIEIVTEPDLRSEDEVALFLEEVHLTVRHLNISEASMEKGTMRLEPNISVKQLKAPSAKRQADEKYPDYKVEVKNINSFKFVRRAIKYEIERQIKLTEAGKKVKQETRGWDEKKQITVSQRGKEEARDYRYFPEPDLPPLILTKNWLESIRGALTILPEQKEAIYREKYRLPQKYSRLLIKNPDLAAYLEEAVGLGHSPERIADLIINRPDIRKIPPVKLKSYLKKKEKKILSDDAAVSRLVEAVLEENPKPVTDYRAGKESALTFLVGQTMKKSQGRVDPEIAARLIRDRLKIKSRI